LILATLRGTPILYYGDELGMEQVEIPTAEQLDRAHSRDGARTPMPWSPRPERDWWLRHGDMTRNVEEMRGDPRSTLAFTRELLALRRAEETLRRGSYASLAAGPGIWAWTRGDAATIAVNLSDRTRTVRNLSGTIRLDTRLSRAGEGVRGILRLEPWEGAVVFPR
jgi:alpha-glucosidase